MIPLKTPAEIQVMRDGGRRLALVMKKTLPAVRPGITLRELDKLADLEIRRQGGAPSFKMVSGYQWATCLNINQGVVHGIPNEYRIKEGDLVSVDLGMFYHGFHTDMAWTLRVKAQSDKFLEAGERALKKAIAAAKVGNRVAQISLAMEREIKKAGFSPIEALTGHGVGRKLHEEPAIPCFWSGPPANSQKLRPGMVLALEIIYAQGRPEVVLSADGWTIETTDGQLAALFEQTVAVTAEGPVIITA